MKKIISVLLICIMVFTLAGCGTEPAKAVHVDNYLAAAVGGDGELIDEALIFPQNASTTKDGITVTAQQAVADQHSMYILLTVTATPEIEFTNEDGFDMHNAGVKGTGSSSNFNWNTVSKDKNSLIMILGIDSEDRIGTNGTASISLWDFVHHGDEKIVYNGNWNLEFDFEVADVTEKYTSESVIEDNGVKLAFNYIDISPFGVYLSCKLADDSIDPGDDWENGSPDIDVVMKDGTEVSVTRNLCSTDYGGAREDFQYFRSGKLTVTIDPAEVSHIMVDGQKVELKK